MYDNTVIAGVSPALPEVTTTNLTPACEQFASYGDAAACWFDFGFNVIPVVPGTKITALKWDTWLDGLSREKIARHWAKHPDHELGFIVGDDIIVFDADSRESMAVLAEIEKAFDLTPNLVAKTAKGLHHYYRLGQGTYAKCDAHCTKAYPERIDVKTGRTLIVLPPSTGKVVVLNEANDASDLTEIHQDAINVVFRLNGRPEPKPPAATPSAQSYPPPSGRNFPLLVALLNLLDPDSGYADWLRVLMAIFYSTGGSAEGLELADAWSRKGTKYRGFREIAAKWASFKLDHPHPVTIGALKKMVAAKGYDLTAIMSSVESEFAPIDDAGRGA